MRDAQGRMVLLDMGAAVAVNTPHNAATPFGFTYGPLRVLEAMASGAELPNALPADDFEQLGRAALVAATGASPSFGDVKDPASLLQQWRALDLHINVHGSGRHMPCLPWSRLAFRMCMF